RGLDRALHRRRVHRGRAGRIRRLPPGPVRLPQARPPRRRHAGRRRPQLRHHDRAGARGPAFLATGVQQRQRLPDLGLGRRAAGRCLHRGLASARRAGAPRAGPHARPRPGGRQTGRDRRLPARLRQRTGAKRGPRHRAEHGDALLARRHATAVRRGRPDPGRPLLRAQPRDRAVHRGAAAPLVRLPGRARRTAHRARDHERHRLLRGQLQRRHRRHLPRHGHPGRPQRDARGDLAPRHPGRRPVCHAPDQPGGPGRHAVGRAAQRARRGRRGHAQDPPLRIRTAARARRRPGPTPPAHRRRGHPGRRLRLRAAARAAPVAARPDRPEPRHPPLMTAPMEPTMQRRIRRPRAMIGALALLTAAGLLSAAPAAHAAGGTVSLTDAYVDQARYNPGSSATVSAVVHETSGAGSWSGNVNYTVTHLGGTVASGSVPDTVAANATSTVTFSVTPPSTDFTGYLVQISAGSSTAATAIDVSSTWTHFPRLGYLTSYTSSTTSASADADIATLVRRYHINAVQFYDWMWRHENP